MREVPKVVIAGAGFGGLEAALTLKKKLKDKIDVKVLDKKEYCLFTPELYDYLLGEAEKEDITFDLEKKLNRRKIQFRKESLKKIDTQKNKVKTDKSVHEYDYLILSIGSEVNTFGIKGVENSLGFKTIKQADEIREILEKLGSRNKINIIGSGLIAIELASHLKKYYKNKNAPKISLLGMELLPGFKEKVKTKVKKDLSKKSIDLLESCNVKKISEKKIEYKKSDKNKVTGSDLTIMATGFKVPEIVKSFGLDSEKAGIKINSFFETSVKNVFAIGDCNFLEQEGEVEKKRAQTAEKEGRHLAKNIVREIKSKEKMPYEIKEIPTVLKTAPTYIFNYGNFVMKNKLANLIEKFIKVKHVFR